MSVHDPITLVVSFDAAWNEHDLIRVVESFADDAIVRDPVGKSPHDPEGRGFAGRQRLAEFWDTMIATGNLVIVPHKRIPVGEHICCVVMTAANYIGGLKTYIEMVACYEVNAAGKLVSLNVYWDIEGLGEQLTVQDMCNFVEYKLKKSA